MNTTTMARQEEAMLNLLRQDRITPASAEVVLNHIRLTRAALAKDSTLAEENARLRATLEGLIAATDKKVDDLTELLTGGVWPKV
jgi:hypothetical protein